MLKSFHDAWYAPNNALRVIAGDVDPPTALAEVKRLFGDIAPKKLPSKPRVRLRPVHPTSFALDTDRPSGTLMIALRTPGPRDADFAALELLSDVLSSRRFDLYGLVPQGKALGAEFALDPLPEAGDRKSTRLNSSHRCISYAVFCLKKKKKNRNVTHSVESTT